MDCCCQRWPRTAMSAAPRNVTTKGLLRIIRIGRDSVLVEASMVRRMSARNSSSPFILLLSSSVRLHIIVSFEVAAMIIQSAYSSARHRGGTTRCCVGQWGCRGIEAFDNTQRLRRHLHQLMCSHTLVRTHTTPYHSRRFPCPFLTLRFPASLRAHVPSVLYRHQGWS